MTIFDFNNYRDYLKGLLRVHPKKGHGVRSVWARAMGCQVAFVSHILHGLHHLSVEQGERLSRHLALNREELEYFLLLIQRDRAGTHQLKKFYSDLLEEKNQERQNIKRRLKIQNNLTLEDQSIYYSKWIYSAIHILLTIPEFTTAPDKISQYFNVSLASVREVLSFLETRGLVSLVNGRYHVEKNLLFINKESPFFLHQQVFFRQKAIESIYQNNPEDIHFASIFTISAEDSKKVKEILLNSIEKTAEIIKPSKEEKLYSVSIDFFEAR